MSKDRKEESRKYYLKNKERIKAYQEQRRIEKKAELKAKRRAPDKIEAKRLYDRKRKRAQYRTAYYFYDHYYLKENRTDHEEAAVILLKRMIERGMGLWVSKTMAVWELPSYDNEDELQETQDFAREFYPELKIPKAKVFPLSKRVSGRAYRGIYNLIPADKSEDDFETD